MTAFPKASPLSGLPEADPPASNTDESSFCKRCRRAVCACRASAFHVTHPQDQPVIDLITRNIKALIRREASKRGWRSRKRMAAARAAGKGQP
jgi:hypothetical protein